MVSDIACPEAVRSVNTNLQTTPSVLSKEWILKEYSASGVFEGLGCLDRLYHMEVDETVRLVVHPPRTEFAVNKARSTVHWTLANSA